MPGRPGGQGVGRKFKREGKIWYTAFQPETIPDRTFPFPPEIIMDTTASDYTRHRLERYEASVDQAKARLRDPAAPGNPAASAPYAEQCAIPALLDSLAGTPDEQVLRRDFARITGKLEVLARESGPGYRTRLFSELSCLVHTYHASACHASICTVPCTAAADPCQRRLIDLLVAELAGDHDVSGIEALLAMIDDNLRRSVTIPGSDAADPHKAGRMADTAGTEREHVTSRRDSGQIGIE
jgi:hypothetical protein